MKDLIPRKVKLGRLTWTVRIVPAEVLEKVASECFAKPTEIYGLCVKDDQAIYLLEDLSDVDMVDTLTHELIHALEYTYGFKVPHDKVNKLGTHGGRLLYDNFIRRRNFKD